MKQDKLKQWVQQSREAFDDLEPGDRIWSRIEKQLDTPKSDASKVKILWQTAVVWRAAAVVLLALSAVLIVDKYTDRQSQISTNGDVTPSAPMEVETYFLAKSEELSSRINQLVADDPALKVELRNELQPLDSAYQTLKYKLPHAANPELVLDAMSANLVLRIELLQKQLQIIDRYKRQQHPSDPEALSL